MTAFALSLALAGAGLAQEDKKKPAAPAGDEATAKAKAVKIAFETSLGKFVLELDPAKAPVTTKNFLAYVEDKFFDNTIFHRIVKKPPAGIAVIQGGGFGLLEGQLPTQKKTKAPIVNEARNGLKNARGTISMARTRHPDSATSQFFINTQDNTGLNPGGFDPNGYAVFGKVVEGMDVIDKIQAVKTTSKKLNARHGDTVHAHNMSDVPVENVVIKTARVVK